MACKLLDDVFGSAARRAAGKPSIGVSFVVHIFEATRLGNSHSETVSGAGELQYSPPHILPSHPPSVFVPAAFNGVANCSVSVLSSSGSQPTSQEEITVHIAQALPGSHVISLITKPGSALPLTGSFTPTSCSIVGPAGQGFITGFIFSFPISMFISPD